MAISYATRDEGTSRAQGLLAAIEKQGNFQRGLANRRGIVGAANRGFVGGGITSDEQARELAPVETNIANLKEGAISDAMKDINSERLAEQDADLKQQSIDLQREANKPKGLGAAVTKTWKQMGRSLAAPFKKGGIIRKIF